MKVIKQVNNHLRTRVCGCCGSTIEYSVTDVELHSSNEDGFGIDSWVMLASIDCPNCKHPILWDVN